MSYHSFDPSLATEAGGGSFEVFHSDEHFIEYEDRDMDRGWYWWACFPGCLPDGDPFGPFETEEEAVRDAQEW
ncbi:hypothetical protein [Candidatus Poriferisocius sp.]|uniref:hypothetical protein n=1 Tax=Candidatus Poriferisocius sp. TaxID=3101276 RepID=UPI003B524C8F